MNSHAAQPMTHCLPVAETVSVTNGTKGRIPPSPLARHLRTGSQMTRRVKPEQHTWTGPGCRSVLKPSQKSSPNRLKPYTKGLKARILPASMARHA